MVNAETLFFRPTRQASGVEMNRRKSQNELRSPHPPMRDLLVTQPLTQDENEAATPLRISSARLIAASRVRCQSLPSL